MASLFVIQGRDQGKRFQLAGHVIGLGRDTANTIQLQDSEVSRQHAELRLENDRYTVVDLGSSNGAYVNNQRVQQHTLRSGDRLQLGSTLMIYTGPSDPASAEMARAVNIVGSDTAKASRIVRSMSQDEGSKILGHAGPSESPWLARARSNLQIMYRTALAVSHTLDIDRLCSRIMELIFEWVEADRGCVMLVDKPSGQLVPKVRRNRPGAQTGNRMSISGTILDYVMKHREGVLTSDAREDQRWDPAGSILKMGIREAICVPMQGRYDIVGVIYIDTSIPPGQRVQGRVNKFTEEHLKLMVAIGHQAALAVEDTSYYSALVQAERLAAIGQTIAGLSHYIKNILQGIRGGSYLIEEGLNHSDPEVVRKGWSFVEKNQEKISNLVLDMLSYSKQRQPEMGPADLNEVIGDVVELMQPRADEANVTLTFKPQQDIPEFAFDPEGIHRAALNVVTNAIDACDDDDGGRVTVSTVNDPQRRVLRVTVEDNGRGIASDKLEKIFNVFESSKGSRGTGLGLAVSQKIVREHDGEIRVKSKLALGSCFTLLWPAVDPETVPLQADADDARETK